MNLPPSSSRPTRVFLLCSAFQLACGLTVDEFEPQQRDGAQGPRAGSGGYDIERPSVSPPNSVVTDASGSSGGTSGSPTEEPLGTAGSSANAEGTERSDDAGSRSGDTAVDAGLPGADLLPEQPPEQPPADADTPPAQPGAPDAGEEGVASDASPSPEPSACPTALRGNRCIVLSLQQVDWDTARALCQNFGGDLVSTSDAQQDADVDQLIAAQVPEGGVWIGVREGATALVFEQADGSPLLFDNFAEGQPNDTNGPRCVEKRPDRDGEWFDRPCSLELPFVCEIAL